MLLLEPFSEADIDRLLGWVEPTPKFLVQWAGRGFSFPITRDQLLRHLEQMRPPHRILRVLDGDEVVGFRREGLMREARQIGETYWSVVEMAVLRGDRIAVNSKSTRSSG